MSRYLVIILAFLCSPPPAWAESIAIVAVPDSPGASRATSFVSHFLAESLSNDERYEVVTLHKALGADKESNALKGAREAYQEAREHFEALELDAAELAVRTAIRKFGRATRFLNDVDEIVKAHLMMAATRILLGNEPAARRSIARAYALEPAVEIDPYLFTNPAMRQIFEEAVADAQKAPRGGITIKSNPSFSRVYLDGRFVGVSPVTLEKISVGTHYIRVEKDGYVPWGKAVDILRRVSASETATLRETPSREEYAALAEAAVRKSFGDSKEIPVAVGQLAGLLASDQLFVTHVSLDGDRVVMEASQFHMVAQERLKTARQTFAYGKDSDRYRREVEDLLSRHFSDTTLDLETPNVDRPDDLYEDDLPSVDGALCGTMTCKHYKTMWVLGVAGGGVGLGIAGIIFQRLAKSDNDDFRSTPQLDPGVTDLRDRGKRRAVIGDVLLIAGAAALVTSSAMWFFWDPTPAPESLVMQKRSWTIAAAPISQGGFLLHGELGF